MAIGIYRAIPVEAIRVGNMERKQIKSNRYFNNLLLGRNMGGDFKERNKNDELGVTPIKILGETSWFTGTGFAIEAKDKAFGNKIEKEFNNLDAKKKQTLIYYVRKEDIGTKNFMHLFEHQFRGNESTIQLINSKNKKQILAMEELHDADEIILKVTGPIRSFKLTNRDGGEFETVGTDKTRIWASGDSAISLLQRGVIFIEGYYSGNAVSLYGPRRNVRASDQLSYKRGTLYSIR